jgi:quinoprotein glucose dehydrogenase
LFTPPSERGTIQLPGNAGGANWSGAAFDPDNGMLFVPSVTSPFLVQLIKPDPARSNLAFRRGPATLPTLDGLPLVKPPYSRLTAYDLTRGDIAWQIPLGDGPREHPLIAHLTLPPMGGGRGWVLATRSLLFVGHRGGRTGRGDGSLHPPSLLAIDKATGQILAKHELPLGPSAPMTYFHQGKQYVAMATGGGAKAEIVAYALP